jgi:hypothetical protein
MVSYSKKFLNENVLITATKGSLIESRCRIWLGYKNGSETTISEEMTAMQPCKALRKIAIVNFDCFLLDFAFYTICYIL